MYERIEYTMEQHEGMPAIKGKGVLVEHIIDMLADGVTFSNIVDTYPGLDHDDCREALDFTLEKAINICNTQLEGIISPLAVE